MLGPVLILLSGVAAAQECPTEFTEHDLRTIVRESSDAILREDALSHKRLFGEARAQLPCMREQLPKDAWAALLVNEAVVQNVLGGDWREPLGTALAIFPEVDGVPPFLADQYAPEPPPPPVGVPIPDDATLFVDGVLVSEVPTIRGTHVAQIWRDGQWRTALLEGQPIPLQWLEQRAAEVQVVEAAPGEAWTPEGRGTVGLQLGLVVGSQLVEDPGTYLSDGRMFGGIAGFATHGVQPVARNGGVFWDVDLPLRLLTVRTLATQGGFEFDGIPVVQPNAYAGAAIVLRSVHVGAGAGVFGAQVVEGETPRALIYPQPHVTIGARGPRADFEAGGGATFTAAHGLMRAGLMLGGTGGIGWRVGLDGDLTSSWFDEEPPGERRASLIRVRVLARVGFAWGLDNA